MSGETDAAGNKHRMILWARGALKPTPNGPSRLTLDRLSKCAKVEVPRSIYFEDYLELMLARIYRRH